MRYLFLSLAFLALSSCGTIPTPNDDGRVAAEKGLKAQSNYSNIGPCQTPEDYNRMCEMNASVFSAPYINSMSHPLYQEILQNLAASTVSYKGKVYVEWNNTRSTHKIMFPIEGSESAAIFVVMGGEGSTLTPQQRQSQGLGAPKVTYVADIYAVRFDNEGTLNMQSSGQSPYSRAVIYRPAEDSVSTILIDDNSGKLIGADYKVPTSIRPLSVAFPITSANLSNYPLALRRTGLSAQDLQSQGIIVNPVVPPECVQPQNANGGVSGQSIIVCPKAPESNTYEGACPPDQIHTANVNSSSIFTQLNTYGQPCKIKYDNPTPVWSCPPVPESMFRRLDESDRDLIYKGAAHLAADAAYLASKVDVANAGGCLNAKNRIAMVACGAKVAFGFVGAIIGMADTGEALGNALDARDQAVADLASFRQSYPCKYIDPTNIP